MADQYIRHLVPIIPQALEWSPVTRTHRFFEKLLSVQIDENVRGYSSVGEECSLGPTKAKIRRPMPIHGKWKAKHHAMSVRPLNRDGAAALRPPLCSKTEWENWVDETSSPHDLARWSGSDGLSAASPSRESGG